MKELKNGIFRSENTVIAETDINTGKVFNKIRVSYVVTDEKNALIGGASDSVPDNIVKAADYAVFTNTLPALGIERILELNPKIIIVASVAAIKNLKEITNLTFNEHIAKDGSELDLGDKKLKFIITPHLNSPDTMFVYDITDKALFSGLAFGSYETEDGFAELYANELERFKPYVKTAAEYARGLDINMICPSVGNILTDTTAAIDKYVSWSEPNNNNMKSAAIFYASTGGNTAIMAKTIYKTMLKYGVNVKCFDVTQGKKDEMLNYFYSSDMLIFGTPTIHRSAAKPIWDIVTAADLVNMKYKPCMVFGSYGWGGEGTDLIYTYLKLLKMRPFEKPFKCSFTPSEEDIKELEIYTKRFMENL